MRLVVLPPPDDKVESLKSFRRAKGLCFTCGDKWSKKHKCPDHVPLHVIEELIEVLQAEDPPTEEGEMGASSDDSEIMMLRSPEAVSKSSTKCTLRLHGFIGKRHILILVDSGSDCSFVNEQLVKEMDLTTEPTPPSTFVIADGNRMRCDSFVPQLEWGVQGHSFTQDVKVLPLGCYDLILGADWLCDHSPMWANWRGHCLRFSHKGRCITLQGITDKVMTCKKMSARKVRGLLHHHAVTHMVQVSPAAVSMVCSLEQSSETEEHIIPSEMQPLLEEFAELFATPQALPPRRAADHRIPLVAGAQPVKVRPYRYTPQQKTEIEKQVKEMLRNGIIQHSVSPFASPVLLVRKKDGSWRFCVDYHHLNALTIKNKHPMPVIDELLDELAGARFFTKLDFRSGYHQIRVAAEDQYKTAFQTHQGMYEFLVMPFGVTNGPPTFQGVVNQLFEPDLRHSVLVFVDDVLVYNKTKEEHLQQLRRVFVVLKQNQFFLKRSKCSFMQQELEYLGHVVSEKGVATGTAKVQAVKNWPCPTSSKALRGFLGLTGYYRKFVQHYGILARPLTQLLKKHVPFQWGLDQQNAFELLKQAMIKAPVLAIPDFGVQFVLETDACNTGIGAVLMQKEHPVAYLSKALCT